MIQLLMNNDILKRIDSEIDIDINRICELMQCVETDIAYYEKDIDESKRPAIYDTDKKTKVKSKIDKIKNDKKFTWEDPPPNPEIPEEL